MAKTNIGQFDTTANNNTDVDNTSLAEGWSPALVNNSIRALMALLAEAWDDLQGYTATGTDTYAVTTSTTYTAYAETGALVVTFTNANTGAATLNVDTIGAAAIKKNGGTALSSGDIAAGSTHILIHDGTDFEIVGSLGVTGTLTVANGGTGATTLTDGGILLGSGTGAITAMSVLADGSIVVGDGTTDPVALAAFDSSTGNLLAAKGGSIGQQTIWVPAGAMIPSTTNGAVAGSEEQATNDVMLNYLAFDAATSEIAQFFVQMPKGWDESTQLICQWIWVAETATSGDVRWAIEATAYGNDDPSDGAWANGTTVDDTAGSAAKDIMITGESAPFTVQGSPAAEEYVAFRAWRSAAAAEDTMAGDAWLLGVKIHYTINTANDS